METLTEQTTSRIQTIHSQWPIQFEIDGDLKKASIDFGTATLRNDGKKNGHTLMTILLTPEMIEKLVAILEKHKLLDKTTVINKETKVVNIYFSLWGPLD